MAKLVFGMNQSLDGYVDHMGFAPGPTLFRHFIEYVRDLTGSIYGRRVITHPACTDHAAAASTAGVARASRMAVRALRPLRRPVSTMEQRAA